MYIDRVSDLDAVFGTGTGGPSSVPPPPAALPHDVLTVGRALALVAANEVYRDMFLPAVRSWLSVAIESARRATVAADNFRRVAVLLAEAGHPVANVSMFDPWPDAVRTLCRSFVTAGMLSADDEVFDGFAF